MKIYELYNWKARQNNERTIHLLQNDLIKVCSKTEDRCQDYPCIMKHSEGDSVKGKCGTFTQYSTYTAEKQ